MPITNTTRIIDLPTKSSLGSGDYFAVDNANGDTSKILATSVSGSSTAGLVAKEYSNAQTYDKGDYSIHVENNVPTLYRANQNIPTAETWNAAHWDQTDAGSELTTANADIASLNSNLTELVKLETFTGTTGTGANAGLLTIPKASYPNVSMIVPCGLSDNAAYSCHYWSQSATNFNIMVKSATGTSWASGVSVTFSALVYKLPSA